MPISTIGSAGINQAADTTLCTTSGNVGIGTASPSYLVDIGSSSGTVDLASAGVRIRRSGVSTDWSLIDNVGGVMNFRQYDSVTPIIRWLNSTDGSTWTERMRIDSSGNLLVGTTDTGATTGTGIKLLPAGDAAGMPRINVVTSATTNAQNNGFSYYSTGAAAYRFYVGAGGTISATSATITALSDQRLKENIRDLDDGLASIMALKPRKFDWKEGKGEDKKDARGFIAQEFETVFPDMIEHWIDPAPEGEEPYKGVNANLIPTLVKAIQELKTELDSVKAELAALKGTA